MINLHDSRLRDRFLISDPGLFRLRSAIRGTVTVLLSSFVLWEISEFGHRPFVLGLVGAMLAMNGAMIADDRTIREQKTTFLLIPIFAAASLALGVLLSPWHYVVLLVLLLFTFGAIYVRQFGSRWNTLGGMAYTAFFSSIFFKVPLDQMGFVVEGVVIAGLFSYAVKFWLIPDRAESAIRWSLSAYRAALRRFVREARRTLAAPKLDRERLRTRMVKVSELALLSEDAILNASDAIPGSGALVRSLQGRLFELELSARKIFESLENRTREQTFADLDLLEKGFLALKANEQALVAEEESAAAAAVGGARPVARMRYTPLGSRFHFQTRQAIQATLATAVASILGTMMSEDRWYWAPLTAYIVFTGTTRGDSLRRASQRFVGTVFGVVAGLALASILQGHRDLEMAALFATMFLAIFTIKASYALYAVFITMLVAIFYSLLGLLTPELLYLRIEQTLVGGLCGAAMSFLVLPVSTRTSLRIELARLFQLLSDQLNDVVRHAPPRRERRARVRALERELLALRAIAGPLKGPLGRPVREETRVVVHGAAVLVHFARQLIVFFPEDSTSAVSLREDALSLARRAAALAARVEHVTFVDITQAASGGAQGFTWTEESPHDHEAVTYSLTRLAQSISAFETRFPAQS